MACICILVSEADALNVSIAVSFVGSVSAADSGKWACAPSRDHGWAHEVRHCRSPPMRNLPAQNRGTAWIILNYLQRRFHRRTPVKSSSAVAIVLLGPSVCSPQRILCSVCSNSHDCKADEFAWNSTRVNIWQRAEWNFVRNEGRTRYSGGIEPISFGVNLFIFQPIAIRFQHARSFPRWSAAIRDAGRQLWRAELE